MSLLTTHRPYIPKENLARADKMVTSFVYHRFGDDRYPSTNISLENFEAHLSHLAEQGYTGLTFSESLDYLSTKKKANKTVCITIDDGYKSFLNNGLPLLQQYGFKATVFINTETVGSNDYLDWDDLRVLMAAGIEIGNHSHSHAFFLNDSTSTKKEAFATDLLKSQDLIEANLGIRPTVFAYPYGEFDEDLKTVVAEAGFRAAAMQSSGVMHSEMDLFQAPRFPMSDRYAKLSSFTQKLKMLPLKINSVEAIDHGYRGSPTNPQITVRFDEENLRLEQVQCFSDGLRATKSIRVERDNEVRLTIRAKNTLSSRRTLYTVTVPDKDGNWHWYSFTYVIPAIR